jgi:hypothetical protein
MKHQFGVRSSELFEVVFHRFGIEWFSFPLNDLQGIHGAVSYAGSKAVAVIVGNQFCFSIHKLNCPLCTGFNALPATVTFYFIYFNDLPLSLHVVS